MYIRHVNCSIELLSDCKTQIAQEVFRSHFVKKLEKLREISMSDTENGVPGTVEETPHRVTELHID